jgi:hypothetical protein
MGRQRAERRHAVIYHHAELYYDVLQLIDLASDTLQTEAKNQNPELIEAARAFKRVTRVGGSEIVEG